MNYIDAMTRAERFTRIGELLAKGITLMLAREAQEKEDLETAEVLAQTSQSAKADAEMEATPTEEDAGVPILGYLRRVGTASPRDIQLALDLPKATAFRRLDRLVKQGLVTRTGKTTAIRYRAVSLNGHKVSNDPILSNA